MDWKAKKLANRNSFPRRRLGRTASNQKLAHDYCVHPLKVAPFFLFNFQRFKQSFEVAFSERLTSLATDNFEKQCRPVLQRFRKDLQQIALIVPVGKQPHLFDLTRIFFDFTYAIPDLFVVRIRNGQEVDAPFAQL